MAEDTPIGQRFSQVYLEKGERIPDSARFRVRLGEGLRNILGDQEQIFHTFLCQELGLVIDWQQYGSWITPFFQQAKLRDVLDAITIVCTTAKLPTNMGQRWIQYAARISVEENMALRIDNRGGVHFWVDTNFAEMKAATLANLNGQELLSVRVEYDKAFERLEKIPSETSDAISSMFKSVEALYKKLAPGGQKDRLSYNTAKKYLLPYMLAHYGNSQTSRLAAEQAFTGFYDWMEAAHNYRHAGGAPQPEPAPLELAVHMLQTGSSYLRWLLAIYRNRNSNPVAANSER